MPIPNSLPPGHIVTSKEASKLTGVPAYTLCFWEKEFAEFLRPPRVQGGQRRYDEASIRMIEWIKKLVDEEKLSIPDVRERLKAEAVQPPASPQLSNEKQIDLILDEIAEVVRERVAIRLHLHSQHRTKLMDFDPTVASSAGNKQLARLPDEENGQPPAGVPDDGQLRQRAITNADDAKHHLQEAATLYKGLIKNADLSAQQQQQAHTVQGHLDEAQTKLREALTALWMMVHSSLQSGK